MHGRCTSYPSRIRASPVPTPASSPRCRGHPATVTHLETACDLLVRTSLHCGAWHRIWSNRSTPTRLVGIVLAKQTDRMATTEPNPALPSFTPPAQTEPETNRLARTPRSSRS